MNAFDLSAFQRDILLVIGTGEAQSGDYEHPYGLGIKAALSARYGEEISHARAYPNLDELVDYGLVEKMELDKRTNGYKLTGDGVALLEEYYEELGAIFYTGEEY